MILPNLHSLECRSTANELVRELALVVRVIVSAIGTIDLLGGILSFT